MPSSSLNTKTKQQLIEEVERLRVKLAELDTGPLASPRSGGWTDGARFRALMESTLDGFFMLDLEGRLREVNDTYAAMVGYTREELLSMNLVDLDVSSTPAVFRRYARIIAEAGEMRFETRHRRKDGVVIDMEINARFFDEADGYLYCFMKDITASKKMDEDLRFAQFALERASEAIIWADSESTVVYANDAACRSSHVEPGAMVGHKLSEFNPDLTEQMWRERWERLKRSGPERIEVRLPGPDGKANYLDAAVARIAYGTQELYVSFARDITDRRRMEEDLRLAHYTLEHASEAIVWAEEDGTLIYANAAACRASHVPIGTMVGRKVWEFFMEFDEADWGRRWASLKRTGAQRLELAIEGPDGGKSAVESVVTYMAYGGRELYVSYGRDITERKQMERALVTANEKFSKVFHSSPIGISISTVDEGRYLDVNDAFVGMYGFKRRDEVIGRTSDELQTWTNIEERPAVMQDARKRPRGGSFYYPFRHQSGEVHEALCAYDLIELEGQDCVVSMFQDVTLQRQAETALRESEQRYHQVFSTVSDAILLIDVETHQLLDVNNSALNAYGYTREAMLRLRLDDINTEALDLKHLAQKKPPKGRARAPLQYHRRLNGTVFPVEISSDVAMLDGRKVLVEVVRDITERKRAEEALRENEETLRTLVKVLPMGVSLLTPAGQIVQMNPALEQILGLNKTQILRGDFRQRTYLRSDGGPLPPDEFPSAIAVARNRTVRDVEIGIGREDGSVIWTSVSAAPLPDRSVVIVTDDITERRLAEQELAQYREHLEDLVEQRTAELKAANEHLEALSRVKDEFVSNVSHELRTPITSLKLFTELLKTRPENRDSYQAHIQRELRRLELMVEDLLRLSRLDSQQVELQLELTDINDLVVQMVSDRQSMAEQSGLKLAASPHPRPLPVLMDQGLVGQVLSILLTNAFNYTPSGGRVVVSTHRRSDGGRSWVGFTVRDTGPGFPPEETDRLFTRFFRGKTGRASGAAGTGLGLAIAREIVDRHQGVIEAENGHDSPGAQFTIWLPVRDEELPSVEKRVLSAEY